MFWLITSPLANISKTASLAKLLLVVPCRLTLATMHLNLSLFWVRWKSSPFRKHPTAATRSSKYFFLCLPIDFEPSIFLPKTNLSKLFSLTMCPENFSCLWLLDVRIHPSSLTCPSTFSMHINVFNWKKFINNYKRTRLAQYPTTLEATNSRAWKRRSNKAINSLWLAWKEHTCPYVWRELMQRCPKINFSIVLQYCS